MLEKVGNDRQNNLLCWKEIKPNESGTGICFLRTCTHKITRAGKPYIACYLQDSEGAIIPGYVWDASNLKEYGIEMSTASNSVVQISYDENYHPQYGMSITLTKIGVVQQPPLSLLSKYVGSVGDSQKLLQHLSDTLSERVGCRVTLPFAVAQTYHMDFSGGKVGGVVCHYCDMLSILEVYSSMFSAEESKRLWSTFLLYIYAHINYLQAEAEEAVDVNLVVQLTSSVQKFASRLQVTAGTMEVIHIFFGYEPKDIFVRLVKQVSENLVRVNREVNVYKTLPLTREGSAGYGTIKNYPFKES